MWHGNPAPGAWRSVGMKPRVLPEILLLVAVPGFWLSLIAHVLLIHGEAPQIAAAAPVSIGMDSAAGPAMWSGAWADTGAGMGMGAAALTGGQAQNLFLHPPGLALGLVTLLAGLAALRYAQLGLRTTRSTRHRTAQATQADARFPDEARPSDTPPDRVTAQVVPLPVRTARDLRIGAFAGQDDTGTGPEAGMHAPPIAASVAAGGAASAAAMTGALAAGALWPWLAGWQALAGTAAAALMAVLALMATVAAARADRRGQAGAAGLFSGWALVVALLALGDLAATMIGLDYGMAMMLAIFAVALLAPIIQLRLGARIGFSVAVIAALLGLAAVAIPVNPSAALPAVIGIAGMTIAVVAVTN